MMFERFTDEARDIVVRAQEHARRLGHPYVGCEHLLLAAASQPAPAGAVLCEHGLTPERIEPEIIRILGYDRRVAALGGLDREALASIGIDLDVVRARIEAAFGPDALARATLAIRRRRRGLRPRLRRPARNARQLPTAARTAELMDMASPPRPRLRLAPQAKKCLEVSVREAIARKDGRIGAEHLTLALVGMDSGMVPMIVAALGTAKDDLRAAILGRCRKAG